MKKQFWVEMYCHHFVGFATLEQAQQFYAENEEAESLITLAEPVTYDQLETRVREF